MGPRGKRAEEDHEATCRVQCAPERPQSRSQAVGQHHVGRRAASGCGRAAACLPPAAARTQRPPQDAADAPPVAAHAMRLEQHPATLLLPRGTAGRCLPCRPYGTTERNATHCVPTHHHVVDLGGGAGGEHSCVSVPSQRDQSMGPRYRHHAMYANYSTNPCQRAVSSDRHLVPGPYCQRAVSSPNVLTSELSS